MSKNKYVVDTNPLLFARSMCIYGKNQKKFSRLFQCEKFKEKINFYPLNTNTLGRFQVMKAIIDLLETTIDQRHP